MPSSLRIMLVRRMRSVPNSSDEEEYEDDDEDGETVFSVFYDNEPDDEEPDEIYEDEEELDDEEEDYDEESSLEEELLINFQGTTVKEYEDGVFEIEKSVIDDILNTIDSSLFHTKAINTQETTTVYRGEGNVCFYVEDGTVTYIVFFDEQGVRVEELKA